MKKTTMRIAVLSLLAAVLASAPASLAQNQPDKAAAEKKQTPAGAKKQGRIPFNGKVGAVDKSAKTITVGERVFQITSQTRVVKAGKPATLDDAVVGEVVGGTYMKGDDGKLKAMMVRLGPKIDGGSKGGTPKKKQQ